MPRYDYRCPDCGTTEEHTVSIDRLDLYDRSWHVICRCGATMRRVFSAIPAIFHGGGWASKS